MSKSDKRLPVLENRLRSSSSSSFSGVYQGREDRSPCRHTPSRRSPRQSSMHNEDTQRPYSRKQEKRPKLDELGKQNIGKPINQKRSKSPKKFFDEREVQQYRQTIRQLQKRLKQQQSLKQQQLQSLYSLKNENQLNMEQMQKLRHLINVFENQLTKINKEKQSCEFQLKSAVMEIQHLRRTESDGVDLTEILKNHQEQISRYEASLSIYEASLKQTQNKINRVEQENKIAVETIDNLNRQNCKLQQQVSTIQIIHSQQQQYQLRINEYVVKASQAQNKANQLQIKYFRIQKQNDDNKLKRQELEISLRELQCRLSNMRQLYEEEEKKLTEKVKNFEGEKRRTEIEKSTIVHEKDIQMNKLKKQKELEIEHLKLNIDHLTLELQEKCKQIRCLQIDKEGDNKCFKTDIETLEIAMKKSRLDMDEAVFRYQHEIKQLKGALQKFHLQSHDSENHIELQNLRLSEQSQILESQNIQIQRLRRQLLSRQESMSRYSQQFQQIKIEFKEVIQERDTALKQFESDIVDKDAKIKELEQYIETKQEQFETKFQQIQKTIDTKHKKMELHYNNQIDIMKEELLRKETQFSAQGHRYQQIAQQLRQANNEICLKSQQLQELHRQLSTKNDIIQQNQQQKQQLIMNLYSKSQYAQQISQQLSTKTLQLNNCTASNTSRHQRLLEVNSQLQTEINSLSTIIANYKDRYQQMESNNLLFAKEIEKTKSQRDKLQEELNKVCASHLTKYSQLEYRHNDICIRYSQINTMLMDSRKQYELLRNDKNEKDNTMIHELMLLKEENGRLKEENGKTREQNGKIKEQNDRVGAQNAKVKEDHATVILENIRMKEDGTKFVHEITMLQHEISKLRQDNSKSEHESAKFSECYTKLQHELSRLQSENAQLQQQILRFRELTNKMQIEHSTVHSKLSQEVANMRQQSSSSHTLADTLKSELQKYRYAVENLSQENQRLRQVEQTARIAQKSKQNQLYILMEQHKISQRSLADKNQQINIECQKNAILEARVRELSEQLRNQMLKRNDIINQKILEIDSVRSQLQKEQSERAKYESEMSEYRQVREHYHKLLVEVATLRKNLDHCVKEYESLRLTHEANTTKLLAAKSEKDAKLLELQEAKMRIRVLEAENCNIQTIMSDEFDKRRKLIEDLVREKNVVVGDLERSKVSRF